MTKDNTIKIYLLVRFKVAVEKNATGYAAYVKQRPDICAYGRTAASARAKLEKIIRKSMNDSVKERKEEDAEAGFTIATFR